MPVAPLSVPVSEGQRLKSQRNSLNRRRRCSNALLLSVPGDAGRSGLTGKCGPGGGGDFEERSCWLAPVRIVVCTITRDADEFALAFAAKAKKRGLRVETDLRNEKINYKCGSTRWRRSWRSSPSAARRWARTRRLQRWPRRPRRRICGRLDRKARRTRNLDLDQYRELRYDGALADDGRWKTRSARREPVSLTLSAERRLATRWSSSRPEERRTMAQVAHPTLSFPQKLHYARSWEERRWS